MGIQENINNFFDWIGKTRYNIDQLQKEHYRRTLLLSLLDTLSKCAYPNEKKNRERFVRLIDEYSKWEYKDYISLPQLRHLLGQEKSCLLLIDDINRRIAKWSHGRILRPEEADSQLSELKQFIKCGLCEELVEKARYAPLLWRMRNLAVHEFRKPGKGFSISNDNSTPYYLGFINVQGSLQSWELCIPCEVISNIVKKCSDKLKTKFGKEGIDPYDDNHFKFGSSWY